jgi:hypothetical protein
MEQDPDSRFTGIVSLSVMFVTYCVWGLYMIAQPEFPVSLLAFPIVFLSPIVFGAMAWRLRRDWRLSWPHKIAFFGSLAFFPLFAVGLLSALVSN